MLTRKPTISITSWKTKHSFATYKNIETFKSFSYRYTFLFPFPFFSNLIVVVLQHNFICSHNKSWCVDPKFLVDCNWQGIWLALVHSFKSNYMYWIRSMIKFRDLIVAIDGKDFWYCWEWCLKLWRQNRINKLNDE